MAFSEQDESGDDDLEAENDGSVKGDKYKQRKRDEKKPHT